MTSGPLMGVKIGGLSVWVVLWVILKTLKITLTDCFLTILIQKKQPLYKCMRVGLNDKWDNQKLENKWVISSYEIYK